ncbi:MAG: N-acetyltransferase [Clostridia bacterium]|nr:N-acetyltransferase [Clostridia bacterium]
MIKIKFLKNQNKVVAYDDEIEIGACEFKELGDTWNIIHTVVDSKYQGQGIAKTLVTCIIKNSEKYNKKLIAECSYAKKIIDFLE